MADAGIGETMLISAALGGGSAALQGQDPLRGALLGGALGGLGYGASSALGSAFGTSGAIGEAAAASSGAGAGIEEELARQQFANLGISDAPSSLTASDIAAQRINAMPTNQFLTDTTKADMIKQLAAGADPAGTVQSASFLSQYTPPPSTGMAGMGTKIADWAAANPTKVGMGIAGLGSMPSLKPPGLNIPGQQAYSGPLSFFKYDPRNYTPYTPTPPNPPYRAQYADGGIAALNQPTGPVERMSQQTVGAGGMYPQSQMERTYFATPTQMPASAEVIRADYDAKTNPYTGVMMAKGGVTSLGSIDDLIEEAQTTSGGMANLASKARSDDTNALAALAKLQQKKMLEEQHGSSLAGGGITALKEGAFVVPADVVSHMGNGSTDAGIAALRKHTGAKPIKGQGDGMSDSIPTSIDGRQPARVADGEAVIEPDQVKRIGKGSSKDGAKKLYAMMDKVRKARTGSAKQGRQINPAKYLPT